MIAFKIFPTYNKGMKQSGYDKLYDGNDSRESYGPVTYVIVYKLVKHLLQSDLRSSEIFERPI